MRRSLTVGLVLLLAVGCDSEPDLDAGPRDAGTAADAGDPGSDAGSDASVTDAGSDAGPDGGSGPGAVIDGLRARDVGAVEPAAPIDGVVVTYVRDAVVGDDPAGFFVQAGPTGPAAFVTVAPDTLDPVPSAGDTVSFSATRIERISRQLRITALEGWSRTAEGADLAALVQDLSAAVNADSIDVYESEWVTASGTVTGTDAPGGTGHRRFRFVTSAVDSDRLSLRLPDTLYDATPIGDGCEVTVGPSPAWRFQDATQLMAFEASQLSVTSCPAPSVLSAETASPTQVNVRFSRPLDEATVMAGDFMFVGGTTTLSATAVAVDGAQVAVTTGAMEDGVVYTVIVSDVVDTTGTALGSSNSAMFTGLGEGSPSLLFTEYVEGTGMNRALEISNLGDVGIELDRCVVRLFPNGASGPTFTLPAMRLNAGESFVLCNGAARVETADRCDLVNNTTTVFNGNDTLELLCDGAVVDAFGQVGFDPGDAWTNGSVSSENQTLRRNCGIVVGDTNSGDTFDVGLQWSSHAIDDASDLGVHCE